jgi:hypothetical protein
MQVAKLHQEDRRPSVECACERGGHRVPCSSDALENRHVLVSCEALSAAHHVAARRRACVGRLTATLLAPCRFSGAGSVLRVLISEADDAPMSSSRPAISLRRGPGPARPRTRTHLRPWSSAFPSSSTSSSSPHFHAAYLALVFQCLERHVDVRRPALVYTSRTPSGARIIGMYMHRGVGQRICRLSMPTGTHQLGEQCVGATGKENHPRLLKTLMAA